MWEVVPGVIAAALSGWALWQGRKRDRDVAEYKRRTGDRISDLEHRIKMVEDWKVWRRWGDSGNGR